MANSFLKQTITCMLLMMAMIASAQEFAVDALCYKVSSVGEVSVTGRNGKDTEIIIPASVNNAGVTYRVTAVGARSFMNSDIRSVQFPSCLTAIDDEAFAGCRQLTSVSIPASVNELMGSSFSGCVSLSAITVAPGNFSYVSIDGVLYNFDRSRLVCVPSGKTGAFTIPEDVTTVERGAMSNCTKLERISIPGSVAIIEGLDDDIFAGFDALKNISVAPDNVFFASVEGSLVSKDRKTLLRCPKGRTGEYYLPDGVVEIGSNAFAGCSGLTSVWLHEDVTTISSKAFNGCDNITTITTLAVQPPRIAITDGQEFVMFPNRLNIHVPKAAKKAYKKAAFWGQHKISADAKPLVE